MRTECWLVYIFTHYSNMFAVSFIPPIRVLVLICGSRIMRGQRVVYSPIKPWSHRYNEVTFESIASNNTD